MLFKSVFFFYCYLKKEFSLNFSKLMLRNSCIQTESEQCPVIWVARLTSSVRAMKIQDQAIMH